MKAVQILRLADELLAKCRRRDCRGLVLITGEQLLAGSAAVSLLPALERTEAQTVQWVSNDLPDKLQNNARLRFDVRHVHRRQASRLLGSDSDIVLVDLWDGLNLNLLGQIANTLRGGGLLVLLAPEFDQWPSYDDPDYQRFSTTRPGGGSSQAQGNLICRTISLLQSLPTFDSRERDASSIPFLQINALDIPVVDTGSSANLAGTGVSVIDNFAPPGSPVSATPAQQGLVDRLSQLGAGAAFTLLVIGDRGRGKSTALGMAIANQLVEGRSVVVTAGHRRQTDNLFAAAQRAIGTERHAASLSRLRFVPADVLAGQYLDISPDTLLVVDEAAALAQSILQQLAGHFSQIVFSTTTQGYEGSGRGFYLRFRAQLRDRKIPLEEYRLQQPLRWSASCHFESFVHRWIGVFPATPQRSLEIPADAAFRYRRVQAAELLADEALLQSLFQLLAEAHYQTQPNDLRLLLDADYVRLWMASVDQQVVGVLLAIEEGGFGEEDAELLAAIVRGSRRPQGNLLAQKMALETGDTGWCECRSLRISRIAVRADCRRRGIATALLETLVSDAGAGMDFISSSFGVEPGLLPFWLANGFLPQFLGAHLDKASGARNLLVQRPLGSRGERLAEKAHAVFAADLQLLHKPFMPELPDSLLAQLLARSSIDLDQQAVDDEKLARFAAGEISLASAYAPLRRGVKRADLPAGESQLAAEIDEFLALLPDWPTTLRQRNFSGRNAALAWLREAVAGVQNAGR